MARRISLLTFSAIFFALAFSANAAVTVSLTNSSAQATSVDYVEYLVAKPAGVEIADVDPGDQLAILPKFSIQSQSPQPIVLQNYYLTAQAKQEVLPFWQGARPLRLRNQFAR